jgi:hypothetical protein
VLLHHELKSNEANWSQTGTFKTRRQNEPFIIFLLFKVFFYSNRKSTNILHFYLALCHCFLLPFLSFPSHPPLILIHTYSRG